MRYSSEATSLWIGDFDVQLSAVVYAETKNRKNAKSTNILLGLELSRSLKRTCLFVPSEKMCMKKKRRKRAKAHRLFRVVIRLNFEKGLLTRVFLLTTSYL